MCGSQVCLRTHPAGQEEPIDLVPVPALISWVGRLEHCVKEDSEDRSEPMGIMPNAVGMGSGEHLCQELTTSMPGLGLSTAKQQCG